MFYTYLKSIRIKYLPLLFVYFANSFCLFSQIAETFWFKNDLFLTAEQLISITIWANVPWTTKIFFGQLLDSVKIFGSRRHIYIIIAAIIMLSGNVITISIANHWPFLNHYFSTYQLLIMSGVLIQLGLVIQDLVADTLCYEIVDKVDSSGNVRNDAEIKQEIGHVQILSRIFEITGSILAALISGIIASKFSYGTISYFIPIASLISILGVLIAKKEPASQTEPVNILLFIAGVIYLVFIGFISLSNFEYGQEIIFFTGTIIVSLSLNIICKHLSVQQKKEIFGILLVLFTVRIMPVYSPGVEWWQIDILKITPEDFAIFNQISIILGLIAVIFIAKRVLSYNLVIVLLCFNIIHCILQLPMIGIHFGLQEWSMEILGIGPKVFVLLDKISEGPFKRLEFLVLCTVITYYSPKHNIASWFALTMSLMSLSFVSGSRIIKKMLSKEYLIERGYYANVGELMITTTAINFLVPTIVILAVWYTILRGKRHTYLSSALQE
ncbi:hypothetical protein NOVO_04240 [Rickettsiales bacterium Ac37b]|nr:hypothetical protein NOVO_04240 [Rickettsiales bacterium Ac37b]